MTAPIESKEKLLRLAWLAALRQEGHRQCAATLIHGGLVCAIGLIVEVAGVRVDQVMDALDPEDPDDFEFQNAHEALGALVGLTDRQTWDVVGMNDGRPKGARRLTFTEIADAVASWFDQNGDPLPPPKKTPSPPSLAP